MEEWRLLYTQGHSLIEIATAYGVQHNTVSTRLKAIGVEVLRRGRHASLGSERMSEAVELYGQGWTAGQMAERFGYGAKAVKKMLRRNGVRLRPEPCVRRQERSSLWRGGSRCHAGAGEAVLVALKRGELVKPERCEGCGAGGVQANGKRVRVEAHHDDYNHPLQVRWLCRRCHCKWHRENVAVEKLPVSMPSWPINGQQGGEPMKYEFEAAPGTVGVIIVGKVWQECEQCNRLVPFDEVGLRNMGDGTIRNQPRCMACRQVQGGRQA